MKRTLATGATSAETPHPLAVPMMAPVELNTILAASHRMFENMETFNRLWLDAVQETNSAATEFAARLAKCSNAAEGVTLCHDWVRERATQFASDSQEATKLWMSLYSSPLAVPNAAAVSHRKHQHRGAGRARKYSSRWA